MAKTFGLIIFLILYIESIYGAKESPSEAEPAKESPKPPVDDKSKNEGSPSSNNAPNESEDKGDLVTLESSHYYKHKKSLHYSVYSYPFDQSAQDKFKHPNVVIGFKFNERSGVFDLPFCSFCYKGWKCIDIYMCIHRCPVLVRVQTDGDPEEQDDECDSKVEKPLKTYSYFFKLNPTTGNFDNFTIPFIGDKPLTDEKTGLTYYKLSNCDTVLTKFYNLIGSNWNRTFKPGCEGHPQSSSQPMNPPLELTIDVGGLQKPKKKQPPKKEAQVKQSPKPQPSKEQKPPTDEKPVKKEQVVVEEKAKPQEQPIVKKEVEVEQKSMPEKPVKKEQVVVEEKAKPLELHQELPAEQEVIVKEEVKPQEQPPVERKRREPPKPTVEVRERKREIEEYFIDAESEEVCVPFPYYSYIFTHQNEHMLRYPNCLECVRFNDYKLMFDRQQASLPSQPITSFDILTCDHGRPLLVNLKAQGHNYLYSRLSDSNRWTNCKVSNLKSFEKSDSNGIVCYYFDSSSNPEEVFNAFQKLCSMLHDKWCDGDRQKDRKRTSSCNLSIPEFSLQLKLNQISETSSETISSYYMSAQLLSQDASLFDTSFPQETYDFTSVFERDGSFLLSPLNCYLTKHGNLFSYYYYLDTDCATALSQSYKPENLQFNDHKIPFSDKAQLPTRLPLGLEVYTCTHNYPLLFNLKTSTQSYYYSVDQESGLLANCHLDGLEEYKQVGQDGTVSYKYDPFEGSAALYANVMDQSKKLSALLCPSHRSVILYQAYQPVLKLQVKYVEPSTEDESVASLEEKALDQELTLDSSLLPSFLGSKPLNNRTTQHTYSIDPYQRSLPMYPNLLGYFQFNDHKIPFSDKAQLPTRLPLGLEVYTCNHGVPILLLFKSILETYYYSVDLESGLWTNYYMDGLLDYERIDEHGVKFYMVYLPEGHATTQKNTSMHCLVLCRKLCTNHKDSDSLDDQSKLSQPTVYIKVAPPNLPKKYTSSVYGHSTVMSPLL